VVNRIDRKVFAPGTCGELRFIYRLAYRVEVADLPVQSRLPMTLNVVAWLPGENCGAWLKRLDSMDPDQDGAPDAFSPALIAALRLKSVEIDLQSARWPSTVRPNMAGHAEYLMRVFKPVAEVTLGATARAAELRLRAAPLENTPDVARLASRPALRKELLSWLTQPDALARIDQGTLIVPEKYLASAALSVAPHGMARLANRPYSQLFDSRDLNALSLAGYRTFKTGDEFLRRLDGLSCTGCHQTHSLAGFHVLGEDDPARRADTLAVAHSVHVGHELTRRSEYLSKLQEGAAPDEFRAPAERPSPLGNYGDTCRPNDAAWSCGTGLECQPLTESTWGQCLPITAQAGNACEHGTIRTAISSSSHRRWTAVTTLSANAAASAFRGECVREPVRLCAPASVADPSRCWTASTLASPVTNPSNSASKLTLAPPRYAPAPTAKPAVTITSARALRPGKARVFRHISCFSCGWMGTFYPRCKDPARAHPWHATPY
jgi:hypothetical protein